MTTWTPKTENSNSWTAEVFATRVFDPAVFDNNPIFDTGTPTGLWTPEAAPNSTWTGEAAP